MIYYKCIKNKIKTNIIIIIIIIICKTILFFSLMVDGSNTSIKYLKFSL